MPDRKGPEDDAIVIRFGGGLNTRASEDEINAREATDGSNFQVDAVNSAMRSRQPFDLVATTPNAGSVDGFVSLLKSDGSVSLLVQSGTAVYELSSGYTFGSSLATVASGTKLRGRIEHNWNLSDKVIITDVALQQPLMEWDGTTLQNITFTTEDGSTGWTGQFRARYCVVDNERAVFANIYDNGTSSPHLIVGSQRSDYSIITVNQRPSSALNDADPFFLLQPDLRYINGLANAFNTTITSSRQGSLYKLTGSNAQDFSFHPLFPQSGVDGDEALTFIGNDIAYGRQGRIESLRSSDTNFDIEQDDLSRLISDKIEAYNDWVIVYNARTQRVHCISGTTGEDWILHKPLLNSPLSPWMKWTTQHSSAFQPTAIMNAYDPSDGLEYIFFGDDSGNVYRMEGSGVAGDGGSTNISTKRVSALFDADLGARMFQLTGWIRYRSANEIAINFRILSGGYEVFDETIQVTLPATSSYPVYGGGYYYSGENYYSQSLSARLKREKFAIPGGQNEFQLEIEYDGKEALNIQEIGIRFEKTT